MTSQIRRSRRLSRTSVSSKLRRYRRPPWISLDDAALVAWQKSPFSSKATRKPRRAASRAMHAPLMPPPTTTRSWVCAAMCSRSRRIEARGAAASPIDATRARAGSEVVRDHGPGERTAAHLERDVDLGRERHRVHELRAAHGAVDLHVALVVPLPAGRGGVGRDDDIRRAGLEPAVLVERLVEV